MAGSGWHKFSITVTNPSNNTIKEIGLAAGITGTDARNPLPLSQVELQAYDENTHQWFDVTDDGQTAAGALGGGNLPGQTAWEFPVRLDVKSSAQIGKSLAVGIAGYPDTNNDCVVKSEVDYGIQIVAPGTSTTGSKPVEQTGGEIPVSKSSSSSTSNTVVPAADLSGSLAHTGAPSQLPMIAGIGGAAIVAGAGAMFVVRRRKAGSAA
ncbi:LPXTG cell wall anchor domain-containing protein [Streptomyces sp. RB6PN25]|uniref:LPXTG cell wall anchor domain-containing protein n=1 Tax=Streptomyces humicola TaxID=2953240 RepID=A0ABT1PY48_9ACTN|nr:LAETG motif-containing sortase-dependent surface protein [Streptomyces humicola]MCQ4082609.1 LPXTG cell wall anchor domain-containing protein [Streptomyces humicola]